MRKTLYTIIAGLLILTGCSTQSKTGDKEETPSSKTTSMQVTASTSAETPVKQQFTMPDTMPDDFDFMVSYGYGDVAKNVIDTYSGTVTKDLIMKGTATADLTFTSEERSKIYKMMKDIDIMGPKELSSENGCAQIPSNTDSWKVTANGHTASFSWTDESCTTTKDAKQLLQLRQDIQHIVALKEAYQALPETEGGYE
ncbi:hypothetical protein H8B09_11400 [Paenibacillus sp. PR3]|uniref:Uncharacterized protein n=1 Tax=Paenibacillus terricola TaxID=2763503 RepID=A0ABR8MTS5_9BACL|nr:hypothetical protein [Paenibacillus terricola]MBD3919361.1 hypothetical protein [Paenibacillus terricola]